MAELVIEGLRASVAGNEILRGVDLIVRSGEVHAVMGPNGAGKSTLAGVVMGRPGFEVTRGSVTLDGPGVVPITLRPFEVLTLRQVNRMQPIPVILYSRDYWNRALNLQFLADEGTIRDEHLSLITYAETPEEAWEQIRSFYRMPEGRNARD